MKTWRPPKRGIRGFDPRDVPSELRSEFEEKAGGFYYKQAIALVQSPAYKGLSNERKRSLLQNLQTKARQAAVFQLELGFYSEVEERKAREKKVEEKFETSDRNVANNILKAVTKSLTR